MYSITKIMLSNKALLSGGNCKYTFFLLIYLDTYLKVFFKQYIM